MPKAIKIVKEIQRMLDLGIIEHSSSPWSSPMVRVEKKNGEIRICLDARKINTRIIPGRERPMNMDDIMNKFKVVKTPITDAEPEEEEPPQENQASDHTTISQDSQTEHQNKMSNTRKRKERYKETRRNIRKQRKEERSAKHPPTS